MEYEEYEEVDEEFNTDRDVAKGHITLQRGHRDFVNVKRI
jgi:hypothetical protein